jgi:hypothetical protein
VPEPSLIIANQLLRKRSNQSISELILDIPDREAYAFDDSANGTMKLFKLLVRGGLAAFPNRQICVGPQTERPDFIVNEA